MLARSCWTILAEGEIDVATLARQEGVHDSYVTGVVWAAFLSPDVIDAILTGKQHAQLSAAQLREPGIIPVPWDEQADRFLPNTTKNYDRSLELNEALA